MGPTPLYDALRAFADASPQRFHMPGHKGRALPLSELNAAAPLDFTELPPTGDLFAGDGPIREAEALWADAFHMEECLFLTGGSTQGMLTALTVATTGERAGGFGTRPYGQDGRVAVLLDRGSHRSAYNALALLDLRPTYLERAPLENAGVPGPISPQAVDTLLKSNPDIKTICITSPTYYGVLSDIPAIAAVAHSHGGTLVVDAAHGAHLPFLGNYDLSAADLVVASAHKTLPAPGQSALLFAGGRIATPSCGTARNDALHGELRRAGSLYGSSSPSFLLMAALDAARAWMEDEGASAYREMVAHVRRLRERFPSLSDADAPLDPARFVLKAADGLGVQKALEALGIYPEMADAGHVVFILTCADGARDVERLERALEEVGVRQPDNIGPYLPRRTPVGPDIIRPPTPEIALTPREARFSPCETIPLKSAEDRISACQVAPYPPGVPIVAPGEVIRKKHLAYLGEIGYNMEQDIQVIVF